VSLGVVVTVFCFTALAELPDKTMIATLVMGSRGRPFLVWLGASAAFACHVTLAVVAGRLLELLPHRVLEGVVTVLFVAGALYLLLVPERTAEAEGEREAAAERTSSAWKVLSTAFVVVGIGEFGDLTQLLLVNFTAHYHQPASVFVGGLAALVTMAALGAFGGRALLAVLPESTIRRVGGVALLGFAGYTIYALVSS